MRREIVVCLVLASAGVVPAAALDEAEKKPVRTYTNEDLERVAPFRGETGALSQPAVPPPTDAPKRGARETSRGATQARDEAYWRGEADRLQERLRPLRQKAAELRHRIEEARRKAKERQLSTRPQPRSQGASGPSIPDLEQRLAAVEDEIQERQTTLEERARRAAALPGWIR